MTESQKDLAREDIERLIGKLDAELEQRGHRAVIYVVGGANIAMAVDGSRTTTDIDVVVKRGLDVVLDAARAVARGESGLGDDWINAAFTGFSQDGGIAWSWFDNRDRDAPVTAFKGSALLVELASPEMMLALKTLAQRPQDMAGIYTLMRMTGIKTPEDIGRNLARFTGRRIFDAQGQPGVLIHIDPKFRAVLDSAPDDLRLPGYARRRPLKARARDWLDARRSAAAEHKRKRQDRAANRRFAAYAEPRCGAWMPRAKTRCGRPRGHHGGHRR